MQTVRNQILAVSILAAATTPLASTLINVRAQTPARGPAAAAPSAQLRPRATEHSTPWPGLLRMLCLIVLCALRPADARRS